MVLCFFQDVIEAVVQELGGVQIGRLSSEIGHNPIWSVEVADGVPVAVVHPGVGAPLAAAFLEELIPRGGRAFVACGGAGVLVPELAVGHVMVPTTAVRDEGTSYHYLPPSRTVDPSPVAQAAILDVLRERDVPFVEGATWTTDAIYRETRTKAAARVAEGCISVEMEAAALFAVASVPRRDHGTAALRGRRPQRRGVGFARLGHARVGAPAAVRAGAGSGDADPDRGLTVSRGHGRLGAWSVGRGERP